jgi:phospholipase C
MMKIGRSLLALLGAIWAATALTAPAVAQTMPPGLEKIERIVVIYMENRSFDHLYGHFPGANGIANAGAAAIQVDQAGKPYATLPPVIDTRTKKPHERFPTDLANQPFPLDRYVSMTEQYGSPVHKFYDQQLQINGGAMNMFPAWSDAGSLVMGYHDTSKLQLWDFAKRYTLTDNFFHAAFGGSFLNHFWMVCACSPKYPNADPKIVAELDASGRLVKNGSVTPDGYAVNTMEPVGGPYNPKIHKEELLPPQDMTTIGDVLTQKGIAWTWYSGGWNEAEADKVDPQRFSFHHQPFAFFKQYARGTEARKTHLKDLDDLLADIDRGTLPAVSWYKPRRGINQHPGGSEVEPSDGHVADILRRIEASPVWRSVAVIVTYDENGGFWDHVAPPKRDRWGPGTRVPTIIVSPFAKKGFVDSTAYDTTSILKLIELRHGLAPLGDADARANGLLNAFQF